MQNKLFLKAADVCELLEVSTTSAVYCKIKMVLPHLLVSNQRFDTSA